MLTIAVTAGFFLLFLFLGNVLQFLNTDAYYMLPVFIILLWGCSMIYTKANTKSLESKDFIVSFLCVWILYGFYQLLGFETKTTFFTYYYLIVFLCIELYANSIRFKSLI